MTHAHIKDFKLHAFSGKNINTQFNCKTFQLSEMKDGKQTEKLCIGAWQKCHYQKANPVYICHCVGGFCLSVCFQNKERKFVYYEIEHLSLQQVYIKNNRIINHQFNTIRKQIFAS